MSKKDSRHNATEITFDKGEYWFNYAKVDIRDKNAGINFSYRYWDKYKKKYNRIDFYNLYYDIKLINKRNNKGSDININKKNLGYKRYGMF